MWRLSLTLSLITSVFAETSPRCQLYLEVVGANPRVQRLLSRSEQLQQMALGDRLSTRLADLIGSLESPSDSKIVRLSHEGTDIDGVLERRGDDLLVEIICVWKDGISLGSRPVGIDRTLAKMLGGISNGAEKHHAARDTKLKTVTLRASTVVNDDLDEMLPRFGFQPEATDVPAKDYVLKLDVREQKQE